MKLWDLHIPLYVYGGTHTIILIPFRNLTNKTVAFKKSWSIKTKNRKLESRQTSDNN